MPRRATPFDLVLRRLVAAGYDKAFARSILPEWWDDAIAEHPTGLEEAVGRWSVLLGTVPASLRAGERAAYAPDVEPKFKLRKGVEQGALQPLRLVATHALRLACVATPAGSPLPTADPAGLRAHVLASGAPWVTLAALLDLCWAASIPVLHLGQKVGPKKMDGMAARFGERYGIAVCANHKHPSRLAFILAHELGHILLGHLPGDGVLLDSEGVGADTDAEEAQANDFAWTLLTGHPEYTSTTFPRAKAPQIANECRRQGETDGVAPGLIAAHHGNLYTGVWGAVNLALDVLEPEKDAVETVRRAAEAHLDVSRLSDDAAAYLTRLVGVRQPDRVP